MSVFPFLAALFGFSAAVGYLLGQESFSAILFVLTCVCALGGLISPGKDTKISGRVASVLAAFLGATMFIAPAIREFRLDRLAAERAAVTEPMYQAMDEKIQTLAPTIDAFYEHYGFYPDLNEEGILPYVDENGQIQRVQPWPGLEVPADPFSATAMLRWAAVRNRGVMLVSVGQNGNLEMPLPPIQMDRASAHPLALYADTGANLIARTYDPTNGALGLGDVVRWHGRMERPAAFEELSQAWAVAEAASPWNPTKRKRATDPDPDPQSARDAKAAKDLLDGREYLAALTLAARARNHRHPYQRQWQQADFEADKIRGLALYQLGHFRASADALSAYLENRPNDVEAHYYVGAAAYYGGDSQTARRHLAAASQITLADPMSVQAHQRLQEIEGNRPVAFPRSAWYERQRD